MQAVRFADDQAVTASTKAGLQTLVDKLNDGCKEYDMKINVKKTKVMKIGKATDEQINIKLNDSDIEQVRHFKYLGSTVSDDGRCSKKSNQELRLQKPLFQDIRGYLRKVETRNFRRN